MVREFAREDERRVMLVLDPFLGPPRADLGELAAAEHAERFERAVSMAACIAWHFNEINSVMQFRTNRFSTAMAPASEIIYDTLRELALLKPTRPQPAARFSTISRASTKFSRLFSPRARSERFPPRCGPRRISSSSTASNFPASFRAQKQTVARDPRTTPDGLIACLRTV